MRLLVLIVAAALATSWAAAPASASAGSSYTWIGSSHNSGGDNHSWTDPHNWQPSGVPGDGDSATIAEPDDAHCTAHVDNVPTVALVDLTLASTRCSSSLNGGSLTVTGAFAWDGGTLNTPTTLTGDGTLSGANSHLNALSADLDVAGTLTLTGVADSGASNQGGFRIVNPYVLHVLAGGTLSSNGANAVQFLSCCNSPAKIVNDGTLSVSAGDFTVRAVEVDQNGTLTASSGGRLVSVGAPLTAGDGAAYSGTGAWKIENGAKARLSGTQTVGSGFHLELGGLDVDAGAELGGTATLAGTGVFDWTGGTVEGNLTIAHGMAVHVSGPHTGNGKRFMSGTDSLSAGAAATVTNHGAITVDQGAAVLTGYQAKLINTADGTLTLAPGTQFSALSCCVNPSTVVNNGELVVPTGPSTDPVVLGGVGYQAGGGTTSVAAGQLVELSGGARGSLASATVSGGGTLAVADPMTVSGTITVGSGSRLNLRARGSLDGTAMIGGAGSMPWTGGAVTGNITVAARGGVPISGPDPKAVANVAGGSVPSTLTLKTHASVASGTSAAHDYISIEGRSTLALASSTTIGGYAEIYAGKLINSGSLRVKPGASGPAVRSGPLTNKGTVALSSGTFEVTSDYVQSAGITDVAHGATLSGRDAGRTITLDGGVLEGTGTVDEGVTNTGATVKPGGTSTGRLYVAGTYTQGGSGKLALDLGARTRDRLSVKGAVQLGGRLVANNLGSYHPALGTKYRMVVSADLTYSGSCATTSGTGSSRGHWAASTTSTSLDLTWRSGARIRC